MFKLSYPDFELVRPRLDTATIYSTKACFTARPASTMVAFILRAFWMPGRKTWRIGKSIYPFALWGHDKAFHNLP
jgi:hypothetical protein